MKSSALAVAAALLSVLVSGKTFTVPLTRTQLDKPITRTQKMVTDFHHKEIRKNFSLLQESRSPEEESQRKMLLKQQIDLVNKSNLAYTGPVLFGTPLQTAGDTSNYVYDSGSGYLTTTSTSCSSCPTQIYNPQTSSTAKVVSSKTSQLVYGSATLDGYMGSD